VVVFMYLVMGRCETRITKSTFHCQSGLSVKSYLLSLNMVFLLELGFLEDVFLCERAGGARLSV